MSLSSKLVLGICYDAIGTAKAPQKKRLVLNIFYTSEGGTNAQAITVALPSFRRNALCS